METPSEKAFLLRCGFECHHIIETSDGGALLDPEAVYQSFQDKFPKILECLDIKGDFPD